MNYLEIMITQDLNLQIFFHIFRNREFIIISQYKKLGSLVSVTEDYPLSEFKQKQYDSK